MSESTALATTQENRQIKPMAPAAYQIKSKWEYCQALAKADCLPPQYIGKPGNIFMAVEVGEALGMPPIIAILNTNFIKGRPTNTASIIAALVRRAGHTFRIKGDSEKATCQIIRSDDPGFTYEVTWTIDRAKQAQLLSKSGSLWLLYPEAMLKARATTECARDACQEVLSGLGYTAEELLSPGPDDMPTVIQGSIIDEEPRPQDTPHGQRFLELAKAQFKGDRDAFAGWISSQFAGKTFGQLTVSEMHAGGDLLSSMGSQESSMESEFSDEPTVATEPEQATDDHDHEQRRFFAVLKDRGLEDHYEGAVTWWAGRDCGWSTGSKGRPSMSITPANLVRVASTMLADSTQEELDQILDDYRCWKLDQAEGAKA